MSPVRDERGFSDLSHLSAGRNSDLLDDEDRGRAREISLGTSTILGIFFTLTLVCAGFFGFGYALGRKSAQTVATAAVDANGADSFSTFKPSPGSPAIQAAPGFSAKDAAAANAAGSDETFAPAVSAATTMSAAKGGGRQTVQVLDTGGDTPPATVAAVKPAVVVRQAPADTPVYAPLQTAAVVAPPRPAPVAASGPALVQVAATSHSEDADIVASALRQKGYTVYVRREPQDNFWHVQLGPYATRKEADAMKDRLWADGFRAIVK